MKFKKIAVFLLTQVFMILLNEEIIAQKQPATLAQLLQQAEQNHPIWLARKMETDAKISQKEVLKNSTLPNIEASYQANIATFNNLTGMFYGQGLLPISGPPSDGNNFSPTTGSALGLGATWSPFTFGVLDSKMKVVEQEILAYQAETQDRLLLHQTKVVVYSDE
jgi:outer membrane protein